MSFTVTPAQTQPRFSGMFQLKPHANRKDTEQLKKIFSLSPISLDYEVISLATPAVSQQLRDNSQLTRLGYLQNIYAKDGTWVNMAFTDTEAETLQSYEQRSKASPQGVAHTLLEGSDMQETMKNEMRSQDYDSFKAGYFTYAKQFGHVKVVTIPFALEHVETGHPRKRTERKIEGTVASRYLNSDMEPGKDSYLVIKPFSTIA